jgi:large subunit ribosomal protein L14e
MSVYKLFVQVGRVAQINADHKLVVIQDIIDQNRVLIDGPGVKKAEANLKHLTLLPFVLEGVTNTSNADAWKKSWAAAKVEENFAKSKVGQVQSKRCIRANLSDFDRFVVNVLKKQRNAIVNTQYKVLAGKHAESEEKRLAPHKAFLEKIKKSNKLKRAKNALKLARKITKRGQAAAAVAKSERIAKYLKAHPDAVNTPAPQFKKNVPRKRTPGRQRKAKDEPARLKRKAEGEKKHATKMASKTKVTKQKGIKPKAKKAVKTETN